MLKRTITYKNYNDVEVTEDFYFNLTEAEVAEMEMSIGGGFSERVKAIVEAKDVPEIAKIFKELVSKAYGEKSNDGKYFRKIDPVDGRSLAIDFMQTEAYSIFYMELATDATKAQEFINGIMPKSVDQTSNNVVMTTNS